MRSIDFCHPNETACTRTACVPGRLRGFRCVLAARSLGSARHDQGRERFTTPFSASAGHPGTHSSRAGSSTRLPRPRACSTQGARGDRASDTPVAPASAAGRPGPSPVGRDALVFARGASAGESERREPRSTGPCPRERVRCVTTRGAFHHQVSLPRIRWWSLSRGLTPVPRSAGALSTSSDRRVTLSRHPGTSPVPHPGRDQNDATRFSPPFHPTRRPTESTLRCRLPTPAPC